MEGGMEEGKKKYLQDKMFGRRNNRRRPWNGKSNRARETKAQSLTERLNSTKVDRAQERESTDREVG